MTPPRHSVSAEVVMLGSGTSTGVPVIGCDCPACLSEHPHNRRSRPGIAVRFENEEGRARCVLVDTATDFREQALRERINRADAVLYTHAHADHVFGLDDLRIFNFRQGGPIDCYGSRATLAQIRRTFAYVFEQTQVGGGKPNLRLEPVSASEELFRAAGLEIVIVPVLHGALEVYGYRFGDFAYVTDCSHIPNDAMARLSGVRFLFLDALRYRPHPTHFHLDEAIAVAERIGAERTWFTHIAHEIDAENPPLLPHNMALGWDGLRVAIEATRAGEAVSSHAGQSPRGARS